MSKSPTTQEDKLEGKDRVIRIPPYYFVHVLDLDTYVTRLEVGPQTLTCLSHVRIVHGPSHMITIPPLSYCIIENPVLLKSIVVESTSTEPNNSQITSSNQSQEGWSAWKDRVQYEPNGQGILRHSENEIRFHQEPYPLYPGESILGKIEALEIIPENSGLLLKAKCDTVVGGEAQPAGSEWVFKGPATYIPHVDVAITKRLSAYVLKANQALHLRARQNCLDQTGLKRITGEEWMVVDTAGAFIPGPYEEVLKQVDAEILTPEVALHLRAVRNFVDVFGKERKAGDEWIVTSQDTEAYIPSPAETLVRRLSQVSLSRTQYCVVTDPVGDDGRPQRGLKKLIKGETRFFPQPGESVSDVKDAVVLGIHQALYVTAKEDFVDTFPGVPAGRPDDILTKINDSKVAGVCWVDAMAVAVFALLCHAKESLSFGYALSLLANVMFLWLWLSRFRSSAKTLPVKRTAGQRWIIYGPTSYIPPVEVGILATLEAAVQLDSLELYRCYTAPGFLPTKQRNSK
eukprot:TRINITY_DN11364_c0_g1::TRINITY_DN11364_c0_g1_i1::g.26488::m.26488 TRINITY_DN11364_c0_g1::TRINITY_DN11364_c0_g1_i1::g.26488  ORF type:complete len:515 (+),score=85.53,sp/Q5EAJ7/MVP_STRPU/42.55/6e-96,sp/Q5EAJ7/MVP_STRPU/29.52/4e-07,Vault/PF01505.13/3.5,Vault/PF01505.13/9.8e-06,Vault/PF01505.13/3.6e-10,Vault/PF01505.13/7.2e-12,Vault/PF01505.13/10,Vault/PF01505.13/0.00016 TRINITY_DN11364_c0_g1_i1:84-1628(+)